MALPSVTPGRIPSGSTETHGGGAGPLPPLAAVVAALFVAGLAFRAQILVVGPLLPEIQADLGVPHAVAGLLSSIPVLCMALLAPLGPVLAASLGPRVAIAACIAAVAGFGLLRATMPWAPLVILTTVGVGIGMGLVGPVLPMVVRTSAPRHAALGTGAYAMGYIAGSSIAAAIAVPIALAFGGWRAAFAAISLGTLAILVGWLVLAPRDRGHVRAAPTRPDLPLRRPAGWVLGLAFGLQSVLFYGAVAWLPSIYIERGWPAGDAAALAAFFNGLGLLTTPLVPLLAARIPSRRTLLAGSSAAAILGAIGIAVGGAGAPAVTAPLAVAAATLLALGIGTYFPAMLTLPVDIGRSAAESSALAALMLFVGYLIASVGPVLLGSVRDATGDFRLAGWLLVGVAGLMFASTLLLSERRLRPASAT